MPAVREHLSVTHPRLFRELHPTKNGDLDNKKFYEGYSVSLVWICEAGHEWECSPARRVQKGVKCYYCSGRKILPGFNDVRTLYPGLLERRWDRKRNGKIPNNLSPAGSKKIYIKCENAPHSYQTVMAEFLRGGGCPYCAGKKVLPGFNDLATTHPELASRVHEDSPYSADEVTAGSVKVMLWQCLKDERHVFEAYPQRLTGNDRRDCPICAGKVVVKGINDFESVQPELARQWDYERNDTTPDKITYASSKKRWWIGESCGHSFERSPKMMRESPRCSCESVSNKKVFSGYNDLETLRPEVAAEWHPVKNAPVKPSDVTFRTKKKYWWLCSKDPEHEWMASADSRVGSRKSGCPLCHNQSKGEKEIVDYVKSLGFEPLRDREVLSGRELDVYIPEKNFAIEFNGIYWHSEACGKDRWYHYEKWSDCREKGVYLFQIWQDDYDAHPELFKRMIAEKLGVNNSVKIPARKTDFVALDTGEAGRFMEQNHLQGAHMASSYYGLRTSDGELVAAMGVRYQRKKASVKISRFASSAVVQGGFSKLLKNILKLELYGEAEKAVAFSYNDYSDDELYEDNGFTEVRDKKPSYSYLRGNVREPRDYYTLSEFKKRDDLVYEKGKTERELADLNGLVRIWDAGSVRWEKPL